MLLEPYWISQKHHLIKKTPTYLEMETGSGRCLMLLLVLFILPFQEGWIMYPGFAIVIVAWTYSKRWVIDANEMRIRSVGSILGITYDEVSEDLAAVTDLIIELRSDSQGIGNSYKLRIRFRDGTIETIADRDALTALNAIVKEIRMFMPSVPLSSAYNKRVTG